MYFTPHILQAKPKPEVQYDEYGRASMVAPTDFTDICPCRCDDSTVSEITDENGKLFRPSYHIVCPAVGVSRVRCGDEVRCLKADGTVRGGGIVRNLKQLNVLNYSEIWV